MRHPACPGGARRHIHYRTGCLDSTGPETTSAAGRTKVGRGPSARAEGLRLIRHGQYPLLAATSRGGHVWRARDLTHVLKDARCETYDTSLQLFRALRRQRSTGAKHLYVAVKRVAPVGIYGL